MKILLHTCCGPCSSACVPRLKADGHEVAMYFANSNIDTREEFERRLENARKVAQAEAVELVADPYDHGEWLEKAARGFESEPEKGRRCERCFLFNLRRAAAYAAANGYDALASSLTVSPHKPSAKVFAQGEAAAGESGTVFLREDFKKRDGFRLSLERSARLGLYRQKYCGCEFSKAASGAGADR